MSYELYHSTFKPTTEFYLTQCGWEKCHSRHMFGPIRRDFFLIHIIISGSGYLIVGDREKIRLSAGQGFIIFPEEKAHYYAEFDDPWEYYWVGFNGSEAKKFMGLCGLNAEKPIFNFQADGKLPGLFKELNRIEKKDITADFKGLGILYLIISEMIIKKEPFKNKNHNLIIKKATDYIEFNYAQNIKVAKLAELLFIDRSQLYRIFKNCYNCPPEQYITNTRLYKACELLRRTTIPVTEIAERCGFYDSTMFCRKFKHKFSVTPLCYRKTPFETQ